MLLRISDAGAHTNCRCSAQVDPELCMQSAAAQRRLDQPTFVVVVIAAAAIVVVGLRLMLREKECTNDTQSLIIVNNAQLEVTSGAAESFEAPPRALQ